MRPGAFIMIIIVLCFIVSWIIFEYFLPQFVKDGGPVVIGLMVLTMLDITFIIERSLTLKKARGKRSQVAFLKDAMGAIRNNDITRAVNLCNAQQGTMANVLRAGLERFETIADENAVFNKRRRTDRLDNDQRWIALLKHHGILVLSISRGIERNFARFDPGDQLVDPSLEFL